MDHSQFALTIQSVLLIDCLRQLSLAFKMEKFAFQWKQNIWHAVKTNKKVAVNGIF